MSIQKINKGRQVIEGCIATISSTNTLSTDAYRRIIDENLTIVKTQLNKIGLAAYGLKEKLTAAESKVAEMEDAADSGDGLRETISTPLGDIKYDIPNGNLLLDEIMEELGELLKDGNLNEIRDTLAAINKKTMVTT